ncbi:MAG: diguanylate cyclase [Spirochaetales bacterium]|nr:diguanylate cyclase [Spirochaetales bacterium]
MARKFKSTRLSGKKILLVDDDQEYIDATKKLLENEGHTVASANNGTNALKDLKQNHYDLILVDYYMPKMTGEELVTRLREFNPFVQVILQTGYASEQPPRELIHRLDIQGYYNKSDGPEKLLLWVDVGLKAAYTVQLLYKSREGLNYILNVTPDLHKVQPLGDLLQGILLQISGLLDIGSSFLAVLPYSESKDKKNMTEGFIAVLENELDLIIHAGTGKFISQFSIDKYLDKKEIELIHKSLSAGNITKTNTKTIVPLNVGKEKIGIIFIDQIIEKQGELDLLKVFANQAAVAIQNARLYQMATFDPLTQVYLRGVFFQAMARDIRIAYRSCAPISLLMIDIDNLKNINDSAGHLGGDQALEIMGQALHDATRQTDIRGRLGGDEFAVVLLNSTTEGAIIVGERILHFLNDKGIAKADGVLPIKCSIGASTLDNVSLSKQKPSLPLANQYFQFMMQKLLQKADELLYQAKNQGGHQINTKKSVIKWYAYEKAVKEYAEQDK